MQSFSDKQFNKRLDESSRILIKYPDRLPIIITKDPKNNTLPDIDKQKYLVPKDLTIGQFQYVIRKRLRLDPSKSLFIFFADANVLASTSSQINHVYEQYKNSDNFLYCVYTEQEVFG